MPDALTSQSHLAITDKLKFWWSRYNGNLVLHVRYSKGRLYIDELYSRGATTRLLKSYTW